MILTAEVALARLKAAQRVPVLRCATGEEALWVADCLVEAGFLALEVTQTTPDAPAVIEALRQRFPHILVGAGTVLEMADAVQCQAAGAQFMVSPVLTPELVRWAVAQDLLMLPGVLTPTEIHQALTLGALAVKIFPIAAVGGAAYLKTLRGPFPQLQAMATGGVTQADIAPLLEAGAFAVGLGSDLLPPALLQARNHPALVAHAQGYLPQA